RSDTGVVASSAYDSRTSLKFITRSSLNVHPSVRQSRSLIASPAANSALVALLVRVEKELVVVFLAESSPDIPVPDFDLLIHDMLLWLTDS
ncbi:hypothetical protein KWH37_18975, partial [Xanthomonas campestris pv. carissae]|nr:hypothetical protein [Xanthomonas campestris pv. carissae]